MILLTRQKDKTIVTKNRSVAERAWGLGGGVTIKGQHEAGSWSCGLAVYLDCNGAYTDLHTC